MIKIKVIVVTALVIFALGQPLTHAQDENYCHDKESWESRSLPIVLASTICQCPQGDRK